MKNGKEKYYQYIQTKCGDQSVFSLVEIVDSGKIFTLSEAGKTDATKVGGNSRVRSWGFTGSDKSINLHAFDFAGVNSAGVISTWGLGAPDTNLLPISQLQEGGVFGFDDINIVPADGYGTQRIVDANSLVEDFNRRTMQSQENQSTKSSTPSSSVNSGGKTICVKTLSRHTRQESVGNTGSNGRSTRTEKFTIIHSSILSRTAEVSHV